MHIRNEATHAKERRVMSAGIVVLSILEVQAMRTLRLRANQLLQSMTDSARDAMRRHATTRDDLGDNVNAFFGASASHDRESSQCVAVPACRHFDKSRSVPRELVMDALQKKAARLAPQFPAFALFWIGRRTSHTVVKGTRR